MGNPRFTTLDLSYSHTFADLPIQPTLPVRAIRDFVNSENAPTTPTGKTVAVERRFNQSVFLLTLYLTFDQMLEMQDWFARGAFYFDPDENDTDTRFLATWADTNFFAPIEPNGRYTLVAGINTQHKLPVFSPLDLANCALWLDPNRDTYENTTASTVADVDNDPIAAWLDQTSQSNDFTQATSANRAVLKLAQVGVNRSIRFDGTNDFLARSPIANLTSGVTIAAVFRSTSVSTQQIVIDNAASASDRIRLEINASQIRVRADTAGASSTTIANNTVYLAVATYDGSTLALYVNRVLQTGTSSTAESSAVNASIGDLSTVVPATPVFPFAGDIFDILIYTRVLIPRERRQLENHLSAKYLL